MTKKQEDIINAALKLFAEEGFKATSTSKVAKRAGVSEGLIFRHFKNKDGLLDAIIKEGEARAKELYANIISEPNPKEALRKTIKMIQSASINTESVTFWKLQFKIKWELELYNEQKLIPIQEKLTQAFTELRYKNPSAEANFLLTHIDGLATRFFLQESFSLKEATQFLLNKYGL